MGGAALGGVMAGCSSEPPQAATPPPSVFRGTSFAGTDLVVDLVEDHGVEQLNLIGPDGRLFAQSTVAVGETRVNLRIIDIQPMIGGFEHYKPGQHDLVAVRDDKKESLKIEMIPDLNIIDVRQYNGGMESGDFGKLAVEIENVGTGPTWVYDITTIDAPNPSANSRLGSDPGILRLEYPKNLEEAIILPGESQVFVDLTLPLVFSKKDYFACSGNQNIAVLVGTPISGTLREEIQATLGGEMAPSSMTEEFTCSQVFIKKGREN